MLNQEDLDKQMRRIIAMLGKAESSEFPEEAEALTGRAQAMMAKYGIAAAQLAAAKPGNDTIDTTAFRCEAPWAREKGDLLNGLAVRMRCRAIWRLIPRTRNVEITVCGYESDRLRVSVMYTSLTLQMLSGARRAQPGGSAGARRYRRAWIMGFIDTVLARVQAVEDRAQQEAARSDSGTGASTALILMDRTALVDRRFNELFPETRNFGGASRVDPAGYAAGLEAGERADIGGVGVQKDSQQALT